MGNFAKKIQITDKAADSTHIPTKTGAILAKIEASCKELFESDTIAQNVYLPSMIK